MGKQLHCSFCKCDIIMYHYFCWKCGHGVRPIPCEHFSSEKDDPSSVFVEPLIRFEQEKSNLVFVLCPKCNRRSHTWARSYWAIDEWNRVIFSCFSRHYDPPKWRERCRLLWRNEGLNFTHSGELVDKEEALRTIKENTHEHLKYWIEPYIEEWNPTGDNK